MYLSVQCTVNALKLGTPEFPTKWQIHSADPDQIVLKVQSN